MIKYWSVVHNKRKTANINGKTQGFYKVVRASAVTHRKLQILMAKTQGFYEVVRASAVTHRKLQISKVVTPPIPD
jgi:hypothetical protein